MAEEKPVHPEASAEEAESSTLEEQARKAKAAKSAAGTARPPASTERPAVVEIDVHDEEPGGPIVSRRDIKPSQS